MDLARMRFDYSEEGIDEATFADEPIVQWQAWLAVATAAQLEEPNAMVIATVTAGQPRTRTVLAKGVSEGGLEFYTNYRSQKGRALGDGGPISATFVWVPLHRQVTFVGFAAKVEPEESDAYFAVRPRDSQLGAWTSDQSSVIETRSVLTDRFHQFDSKFPDVVPRPPHWGGYRITPAEVEFWQGRSNRLHDRIRYRRIDGSWRRDRLAP